MRIAVCVPQVPFERGGAEILAETLVAELRARDHTAELVTIPFKWYPGTRVLTQALLWRLADLEEANGRPIDLAIATKDGSRRLRFRFPDTDAEFGPDGDDRTLVGVSAKVCDNTVNACAS